ncbi:hypothetical protein [Anaeromyxobacter terrae]|uniref:hypothetical protein n=1 Tax=Anaeromyxobacter terrae TaxID=2925406 RepID=UPI001F5826EB|nr:hypothetical protein [Anaeromyxobacter sp. SG22]
MRWLVQPAAGARARPPVALFLVFAGLALAGLAVQRLQAGGLSAAGVEAFYRGAEGGEPLSAAALWEEVHVGAFVYGFVLFMLSALAAVAPRLDGVRGALVLTALAATLADLFAPFAVSARPGLGALRVATSVLASAAMWALLAAVAVSQLRAWRDARA